MLKALPVVLAGLVSPRFFCRWLCPAGLCQDAVAEIRCAIRPPSLCGKAGRWGGVIVGLAIGAALFGYPLFVWMDPLALFSAGWGLIGLLVLALIAPHFWCVTLCPLGAMQDGLTGIRRLVTRRRKPETQKTPRLGRRAFLGLGAGAIWRLAAKPKKEVRRAIRPPIVMDEEKFVRLCARCGACVKACPSGLIVYGGTGKGLAGILAPEVRFTYDYCDPGCTRCGEVCPTGAIPAFTREQKTNSPMGIAVVSSDRCLIANSQECGTCANTCPYRAIDLSWDPVEMASRIVITPTSCIGCGCCESVCPVSPKAITVRPLSKEGEPTMCLTEKEKIV